MNIQSICETSLYFSNVFWNTLSIDKQEGVWVVARGDGLIHVPFQNFSTFCYDLYKHAYCAFKKNDDHGDRWKRKKCQTTALLTSLWVTTLFLFQSRLLKDKWLDYNFLMIWETSWLVIDTYVMLEVVRKHCWEKGKVNKIYENR